MMAQCIGTVALAAMGRERPVVVYVVVAIDTRDVRVDAGVGINGAFPPPIPLPPIPLCAIAKWVRRRNRKASFFN